MQLIFSSKGGIMTLYDTQCTTLSLETLKTLTDIINFPVCLCGGWAVYFTINQHFKQKKKRDYIGSQDIDIGFFLPPMMTKSELESTTLFKTINLLESQGFQPEGFRYKKEIQINNQKTIKRHPTQDLFVLYVDILVNSYPPSLYDLHPHCFFEVPLIENIYQDEKNQVRIPRISNDLFIPTRPLLTAMKIQSFPSRGQSHHKKIKDLCDLYSLLWFSKTSIHENINEVLSYTNTNSLKRVRNEIDNNLMRECEQYLGEPKGSLRTILNIFDTYL